MIVARFFLVALMVPGLAGCSEAVDQIPLTEVRMTAKKPPKNRICEAVHAVATGFGEQNVTGFAQNNLDVAIDKAKDRLSSEGAKGFSIEARRVACEGYIDFGGSLGREHKCRATAKVCGQVLRAPGGA